MITNQGAYLVRFGAFENPGVAPKPKDIAGIPAGAKVRLRFRRDSAWFAWVKLGGVVSKHFITGQDGKLCLGPCIESNHAFAD